MDKDKINNPNNHTINVHSVKYVGINKNQTLAIVSVDDSEPFGFFVALDNSDESLIYKAVIDKIQSGDIGILPSDVDTNEYNANEIRNRRDYLLDETDKYMTIDYPISKDDQDKLRVYRQALRDITDQQEFPDNVTWPEKPVIHKTKS
jgi:hypothetical protein